MNGKYVKLQDKWTIRGSSEKCIMFDFKGGLFEERFILSKRAYEILRLATGRHTCEQIGAMLKIDPRSYIKHLLRLETIELTDNPSANPRSFQKPYKGENFLGRIMIHITGKCNLNCLHCYLARRKWDELTLEEIKELIKQAAEMNVASFSITGGEPFIREDLMDILRELDQKEMKIEGLFTNGTMLPSDFIDQVRPIQEFPFFVSINGPSSETHNEFMGANDAFKKSIETIRILTQSGIRVFANTSLNVFFDNEQQLAKIYQLIKDLHIYRWRISSPFLEGSWKENFEKYGISTETELQIMLKILKMWLDDGRPFELELGHIFRYIKGKCIQRVYSENDYVCDYFRDRIVIMPNGEISACSLLIAPPYILGNIRNHSLQEIWESDKMRYYKDLKISDVMEDKCRSCTKIAQCGMGCRANAVLTSGVYENIDPEICGICTHPLSEEFSKILQKSGIPVIRE